MRRLLIALFMLALPALVQAQTQVVPSATHLGFDQPNQTPAVANGFTYNAYVDAAAPVALTGVTCATGTPATTSTCVGNWPTMTPGVHVLTLTQASGTAESAKATPALSITVVILVAPTNLRQVP